MKYIHFSFMAGVLPHLSNYDIKDIFSHFNFHHDYDRLKILWTTLLYNTLLLYIL